MILARKITVELADFTLRQVHEGDGRRVHDLVEVLLADVILARNNGHVHEVLVCEREGH